MKAIAPKLKRASDPDDENANFDQHGHFIIDEKNRSIDLTEDGHEYVENLLIKENLLRRRRKSIFNI